MCVRHLCDLFLNSVANQSLTLRIEVDHLISRAHSGELFAALAMQRIASLLNRYPDCCEKLGVLIRLFRDMNIHKRRNSDDVPAHQLRAEDAGNQQDIGEKESCQIQREAQAEPVGCVQVCELCDAS